MNFPRVLSSIILFILAVLPVVAEKRDPYQDYINTYGEMAVEQQQIHGIPASITLAQGLLESNAGRSTLATRGNNHFGIKCHNEWTGDTLLRSDDAPNECFRSYPTAAESFADHARFLLRKRYKPCFGHDVTDYVSWARTLRQCGYATDPNYASRLISIIERYALYLFDTDAGRRAEEDADFIRTALLATHPIRRSRGLHCVFAAPGDTYASIAKELGMKTERLLELNDRVKDGEIKPWEEVYLQPKRDTAPEGIDTAVIGEDESIHSIAQRFGMKLEVMKALNPKAKDRPGTRLRLR